MSNFQIEGTLHAKGESKTSGNFTSRELVLKFLDGKYEQFVPFQLVQDRCDLLDKYQTGEIIRVHFDLRGREWQGRYFPTLNAWKLESVGQSVPSGSGGQERAENGLEKNVFEPVADLNEDLPF